MAAVLFVNYYSDKMVQIEMASFGGQIGAGG